MPELTTITGAYSAEANGWVSDIVTLTGDCYLEVTLPGKGRVVIKKAETIDGPYPKALITKWGGPDFRIRILHGKNEKDESRYIRVITTETPDTIQLAKI